VEESRFTDSQIMAILKQNGPVKAFQTCILNVASVQWGFYKWHIKLGGMVASLMKRPKRDKPEALSAASAINQACPLHSMSDWLKTVVGSLR